MLVFIEIVMCCVIVNVTYQFNSRYCTTAEKEISIANRFYTSILKQRCANLLYNYI